MPIPDLSFLFEDQLPPGLKKSPDGKRYAINFENAESPTDNDLALLRHPIVAQYFELKNGAIVNRFVPIRERIVNPAGRIDYGWGDEMRRKHLTAAYARGWQEFPWLCRKHDGVGIIVGGGPSLRKTIPQLRKLARQKKHFIITTNKTHDFLLNLPKHGLGPPIIPWGSVLLDPCDWVKDYITPRAGIQYLIGDQCAPETFDVFEKPGIIKWVWRSTSPEKDKDIVPQHMFPVFGGSTGGMRCRTIMYLNGFRKLLYFGFDSSCDENDKLHGYEKWDSVDERTKVKVMDENGFEREFITNTHMARQAQEWLEMREKWIAGVRAGKHDWVEEVFYGEGLLPTIAARLGQHADPKRNQPKDQRLVPGDQSQIFTTEDIRSIANAG